MDEEEEKQNKGEKDCLLGNKTSKLIIMKKEKNKYLKSSTKNNSAKKLTMITIFSLKKNYNSQPIVIIPMLIIYLKPGVKKWGAKN